MPTKELATLSEGGTVPDLIRTAIATGKIDSQSIKEMLEIKVAYEANEAKKEFNAAFAELDFPPIYKTAKGLNSDYPPWHEIQRQIKPILRASGFALSFTSGQPDEKNRIPVVCKLKHRSGHEETGEIWQPIDAVSRGMNANQAMAAATSYGKRYSAANLLNLEFVGMDNDAQAFSLITEPQREEIEGLIKQCQLTPFARSRFLEHLSKLCSFQVKAVGDIRLDDFKTAKQLLENKLKKLDEEKGKNEAAQKDPAPGRT